jgi:predicted nucleic acid-binding protein
MAKKARGKEAMLPDSQVLVDSDAFVSLLIQKDAHHAETSRLFSELAKKKIRLVTSSFVIAETATVLSHKIGQETARAFLEGVISEGAFPVIHVSESLQSQATAVFKAQESKGTSMTDCVNVALMKQLESSIIFSYDLFYPKRCQLQLLSSVL